METELLHIVQTTIYHVNSLNSLQNGQSALLELFQILFEQFKYIGNAHAIFLDHLNKAIKAYNIEVKKFEMRDFWNKIQNVVRPFYSTHTFQC